MFFGQTAGARARKLMIGEGWILMHSEVKQMNSHLWKSWSMPRTLCSIKRRSSYSAGFPVT